MAEAGFYFCGTEQEPDSVACFMCDKHLDNWEATDDPWSEHKRHAPQCAFVKLSKIEGQQTVSVLPCSLLKEGKSGLTISSFVVLFVQRLPSS